MYVRVLCPLCNNYEWVDLKVLVSRKEEVKDGETQHLINIDDIKILDVVLEDRFIDKIQKQLKSNHINEPDKIEEAFVKCFGIAPGQTKTLTWQLYYPEAKNLFDRFISSIILFFQNLRYQNTRVYFMYGVVITAAIILLSN